MSNDLMSCGHPETALNHPPGTIPEGEVRTVYCVACVADHREAEREVIEAARKLVWDGHSDDRWRRVAAAILRLERLEGRQ